jgi:hypothetical protein
VSLARRGKARAALVLLVGARQVEWAVLERGAKPCWREGSAATYAIAAGGEPLAALCGALQALPAPSGVQELRVLVADSWLAAVTLPWSDAMRDGRAASSQARARLAAAGFAAETADIIRIDDAPFGVPRLALAYPAALMAALEQLAARSGARLASVLPLAAAGWEAARRQPGAAQLAVLALAGAGMLAIARAGDQRLQELTVRVDAGSGVPQHELQQLWQRQCLRDPQLAALGRPALLDLSGAPPLAGAWADAIALPAPQGDAGPALALACASGARRSGLDAIQAGRPLTRPQWAALGGALVLACAALGHGLNAGASAQALQASLEAPRPVRAAPPVPAWSAAETARVGAVNVAIRELNLPFDALLRALAPAPDLQVAVLSVTTTAGSSAAAGSSVKIVAEARTRADMARYAAFVGERKPFTGAYLVEHELDETSPERPYRFTLEAMWKD